MLMQFKRRKRRPRRLLVGILVVALVAVIAFAGPSAYRESKTRYSQWKCERALKKAYVAYQAKDFPTVALSLQVAIRADGRNPQVWKTIADMTEAMGGREAILQRQQVVLLMPGDVEAQLSLAVTALRFGDIYTARDALKAVPEDMRNAMSYRRVVALYAMVEGNGSTAEDVLSSVMKSDNSDGVRLAYATVRMSHPDAAIAASARQELAGMAENPAVAPAALRELVGDAIQRKDLDTARTWAERLVKLPTAQYSDHLALASLMLLKEKRPLDELLPALQEKAAGNASSLADLVRWLIAQRQAPRAKVLVDAQPDDIKTSFVMKSVRFDLAIAQADWPAVGELLRQGALGPVPDGSLRLAMEARNVGELKGEKERLAHWQLAVDQSRTNIFGLRMLYKLSFTWKWIRETEITLLAIAQNFSGQTWAHEALIRGYTSEQNGPGLAKVFALWHRQSPSVDRLTHDWALMDMLVNPTNTWNQPKVAAEQLYLNEIKNPTYTTTCALAYAQAGRTTEAVALVDKMKPDDRLDPRRAPYLAYVYAQGGRPKEAREILALPRPDRVLKEELQLVEQAQKRIAQIEEQEKEIRRLTSGNAVKPADGAPKR